MPTVGGLFEDVRGDDRTMRVSCHPERDVVVVSLWLDRICRASFRLSAGDLPRLRAALCACAQHPDAGASPDQAAPPDQASHPGEAAEGDAPTADDAAA